MPIPPLPVGVEDYTLGHFKDYLKAASLFQVGDPSPVATPTPEKTLSSTAIVPAQFFSPNFTLSNPNTFASVFPTETFGPEVERKVILNYLGFSDASS